MFSEASKFFSILFLFFLLVGCKAYHSAIPLNEAINKDHAGLLKVTLNNGDEYIYENIINENGITYGVAIKNGLEQKTELKQSDVKKVEIKNKKSSTGLNILGVGVGVSAIVLGILMFQ